ncbi:MAG TPA: branched-chain amino acid ABC transporter permease [Candidatus Limnocylindrales bacterium]|jgi:branched-chain amino acid transport system permease protein|nr:branched-chain amino acid ABC transporter permease [Candidatus Limnocylindrales bacterium]
MEQLIQTAIIGLSNGLIYALVALGYTLVYGIIELINFAHGSVFMLGSMLALTLFLALGIHGSMPVGVILLAILLVLLVTMTVTATLNVAIERVAYRPLRHAPKLAPLISAIGMDFVLQNVGLLWKGPANQSIENIVPPTNVLTTVLGLQTGLEISYKQLMVAAVTIPLLVALTWFVTRTRQGKAMRATAQDPDTSGLMGINVNRTIAITFLIGGALAGAAGTVQILFNNTTVWNLGFRFGLNAFTSAVLGGIGNLPGAVLGGLILGMINAYSDRYLAAQWTNAIVFAVLIGILVFRPTGLLGQQLAERA